MKTRDEEIAEVPLWTPTKPWPKGVRGVGMEELDVLGVNKRGQLFWDGKPIEVREFSLRWPERTLAVAGLLTAVAAVLLQAWQWGCELVWLAASHCPPI